MMSIFLLLVALAAPSIADKLDQVVALPDEQAESGTVIIKPPTRDNVNHVTSSNQYQKLYPSNGKYQFGYQLEDQFRVEERLGNGQMKGIYAYIDDNGTIIAYRYSYDGYQYKQESFELEDIPDDLRLPGTPGQLPERRFDEITALFRN